MLTEPHISRLLPALLLAAAAFACDPAGTTDEPLADAAIEDGADGGTPIDEVDAGEQLPDTDAGEPGPADSGTSIVDCPPLRHEGGADDYSSIEGRRGASLRDALLNLIDDHFELSYNGAKDALFGRDGTDVVGGRVECIYTGQTFNRSELDAADGYNVEHSWPQSDFFGTGGSPKTDLHHLFAAEKVANSYRASLAFGETDCATLGCSFDLNGSSVGPSVENGMRVFEVRPKYRGEVARAHFYMSVRHGWSIPDYEENVLRRWNRCDPPDAAERARNDAIEAVQHNRNPFVDRPEFVDYITDFD